MIQQFNQSTQLAVSVVKGHSINESVTQSPTHCQSAVKSMVKFSRSIQLVSSRSIISQFNDRSVKSVGISQSVLVN